jgi:hypothetical protein
MPSNEVPFIEWDEGNIGWDQERENNPILTCISNWLEF